jgi:predicted DNA-binding protein (UPF0251 family)
MPRPAVCRRIAAGPVAAVFKPAGIPARDLESVTLALDEYEALRLADLEGLDQEEAARHVGVSRPTLGRILNAARRKVAAALVGGRVLRIEGGPVRIVPGPRGRGRGDPGGPRCRRRRRGRTDTEEKS